MFPQANKKSIQKEIDALQKKLDEDLIPMHDKRRYQYELNIVILLYIKNSTLIERILFFYL